MTDKISPDKISGLSSTLLIPLWAKAVEFGRSDALLKDSEAVRMMGLIDYDFDKFASSKLSQPGCCARAAIIDNETRRFMELHPDAVVVQLGAGLDARFERLGKPQITAWYDLDLPEVIAVRRRLLPEDGNYYLSDSMFETHWIEIVAAHKKSVLLILEGVLMYFSEFDVKRFFLMVARYFPQVTVLFDSLPPLAAGRSKQHDALRNMERDQRPEFVWALKDPVIMESWQPGLKVAATFNLSDTCRNRYPWWARLIYGTQWGRRNFDLLISRVEINHKNS